MGNTYTPNFFFRKPDIGDYDWADEFWQNQDIKDMLLASLYSDNYVQSGLDFHISSVFDVQWTEGEVFINDNKLTIPAGVLTLPPGSPSYRVPTFLYVDDTGAVNYSTTPIDLTDKVCVAVCDVADSDIKLIANAKKPVPNEEINDTYYVDINGDDNASGSATEPWRTIQGALDNVIAKNFSYTVKKITVRLVDSGVPFNITGNLLLIDGGYFNLPLELLGEEGGDTVIEGDGPVPNPPYDVDALLTLKNMTQSVTLSNITFRSENEPVSLSGIRMFNSQVILNDIKIDSVQYGIVGEASVDISSNTDLVITNVSTGLVLYDKSFCIFDGRTSLRVGATSRCAILTSNSYLNVYGVELLTDMAGILQAAGGSYVELSIVNAAAGVLALQEIASLYSSKLICNEEINLPQVTVTGSRAVAAGMGSYCFFYQIIIANLPAVTVPAPNGTDGFAASEGSWVQINNL